MRAAPQTKWEETSDAEKPAAVAIIVGAVIAQIAIGATVDAVDRLPLVHQFLEFVGLAVTVVYAYRYFTDPAERCAGCSARQEGARACASRTRVLAQLASLHVSSSAGTT